MLSPAQSFVLKKKYMKTNRYHRFLITGLGIIIIVTLLSSSAFSQSRTDKNGRISFSPAYLLFLAPRIQADYYYSPQIGLGADIMQWKISFFECDFNMQWLMPYGRYFLSEKSDWYFGGGILFGFASSSCGGEANLTSPMLESGYTWLWDTFNIDLGFMIMRGGEIEDDKGNSRSFNTAEIEFRLGWMF